MKELNRFRQFLTEGQINENEVEQTRDIIVQRLQDELGHDEELDAMYQGYIPLVQQADSMADLAMLIDKFGTEVYNLTGDGQWEEYIVKDTPLVDRKTFEVPKTDQQDWAQDWADEQDAMYGKANFVEENDKALDEILNEEKYEYVVTIEKNGKKTETLAYKTKTEADTKAKKINGGSMGKEFKATVSKDK